MLKEKYEKKLIKSNMTDVDMFYAKLNVMERALIEEENINEEIL